MPLETIGITSKLLLAEDQQEWRVMGSKNEIEQILLAVLGNGDSAAQNAAWDLINRLVARGHSDFQKLL